jgi:autotransporter-associated beta strand protein
VTANTGKSVTLLAATGGEVDFTGNLLKNGTDTTAGITVGDATHAGTVKLAGANTYAGGTTIKAGSVVISGGNDRLLTTSSVTLGDGRAAAAVHGIKPSRA